MAEKRKAPGASEGARRPKREAPTIDLTATEIKEPTGSDPAESAGPAQEPASEPPRHDMMGEPPAEPAASPPPPPEEPTQAAFEAPPPPPGGGSRSGAAALAGGIVGGIIVALAAGALWYTNEPPSSIPRAPDMTADIAGLQKQIQELRNRPLATPAVDKKTFDALNTRVATLEASLAKLPKSDAGMAERLTAAENAMKSFELALTTLGKRGDDVAANAAQARAQAEAAEKAVAELRTSVQNVEKSAGTAVAPAALDAVAQRIDALERSVKSARAELAKVTAAETAARRTLVAAALRNAVMNGAPFAAEFAQAKSVGADKKTLAALAPFAASGVPASAALARELHALVPAMLKAAGGEAPQGSFLERLQANASKLVRITPVTAPPGDDPSAVLARVEIAAAHADIAGALSDLARLPDAARAPAQGWIDKARARQAALAAANDFAAASARALSQP